MICLKHIKKTKNQQQKLMNTPYNILRSLLSNLCCFHAHFIIDFLLRHFLYFSYFCECCGTVRYRETSKERFVIKDIMLGIY